MKYKKIEYKNKKLIRISSIKAYNILNNPKTYNGVTSYMLPVNANPDCIFINGFFRLTMDFNNMDAIDTPSEDAKSKKMEEDRRLIDEVNQKIADNEDALLDIPKEITTTNDALMMETMTFCYEQLRENYHEAEEISDWIKKIRVELKKNIIRKQNREINNREIYAYMHDVFGKDIINLFDVKNSDVDLDTGEDRPKGDISESKKLSNQ